MTDLTTTLTRLREAAMDVVLQEGRYYRLGSNRPDRLLAVVPQSALRELEAALAEAPVPDAPETAGIDGAAESWRRRAEHAEAIVRRVCSCPYGSAGNRTDIDPLCPVHFDEAVRASEYLP